MLELLRILPLPAADWMNEQFETPLLKALETSITDDGFFSDNSSERLKETRARIQALRIR